MTEAKLVFWRPIKVDRCQSLRGTIFFGLPLKSKVKNGLQILQFAMKKKQQQINTTSENFEFQFLFNRNIWENEIHNVRNLNSPIKKSAKNCFRG